MKNEYVLVERMDPPAEMEQEWNGWLDAKYIPSRLKIPGFRSARRFEMVPIKEPGAYNHYYEYWIRMVQRPKYLIVYDIDNPGVVASRSFFRQLEDERVAAAASFEAAVIHLPNYQINLYEKLTGVPEGEYRMPETAYLLDVGIDDVDPGKDGDFDAWYNTEHFPMLAAVPGFITLRRFRAARFDIPDRLGLKPGGPKFFAMYDIESEEVLDSDEFDRNKTSPWTRYLMGFYDIKFRNVARRVYPRP